MHRIAETPEDDLGLERTVKMETIVSDHHSQGGLGGRFHIQGERPPLTVRVVGGVFRVLAMNHSGFTVAADDAPKLRGRVDIYEGEAHIMQCLVMAGDQQGVVVPFTFKRATRVAERPALDFHTAEHKQTSTTAWTI